jgi:tyrosyl-tRNA synthetase
MTIIEDLKWRGLLADCTDLPALERRLAEGPVTVYAGFDPTADSLHIGNLVPLLALRRFQQFGHRPIALAGGATGMIGDPSGRATERSLASAEEVAHRIERVRGQLQRLLDFSAAAPQPAKLLDNAAWTAPLSYLEFLREVGKHFTVNVMIAKESVRARMEDREGGISYTEFSYMLLQAHDFYHLYTREQCQLQIGGTDQWGNITAGTELIRKKASGQGWGLTLPLITDASGQKFGKSTGGGSVWLDPQKTSVYRFYQYFINVDDRDVVRYLKFFTFLPPAEIEALASEHERNPGARAAHKALAREFTTLVHGEAATADAIRASEIMFGGGVEGVSEAVFRDVVGEVPTQPVEKAKLDGAGLPLAEALVLSGLSASKGQARKDIEGGGIYLNNVRAADAARAVGFADLLFGQYVLLRKGKRTYAVLEARG